MISTNPIDGRKRISPFHIRMYIKRHLASLGLSMLCMFWLATIWFWRPSFVALTYDDAFYYAKISQNIAAGYGPTFDQLNLTNGFHPLWVIVVAIPAIIIPDDPALMMRFMMTIQVLLVAISLIVWVRPLSLLSIGVLASYYAFMLTLSGLESALQFALLAAGTAVLRAEQENHSKNRSIAMGLIGGLVALARIESIVFVATVILLPVLWPVRNKPHFNIWVVVGLVMVLFVPYLLWNYVMFQHWLPVSGSLKFHSIEYIRPIYGLLSCCLSLGVVVYWIIGYRNQSLGLRSIFPLLVYATILLTMTWIVRARLVPDFWYLSPHLLLFILLAEFKLQQFILKWSWFYSCCLVILLAFAVTTWIILGFNPSRYASRLLALQTGNWLATNTPKEAIIAGWDIGLIGAQSQRRLMNLEGLVNSWDFKENYLDKRRVDVFINEVHRVDFIAQREQLRSLRSSHGSVQGLDLSDWYLIWAACERLPLSIVRPQLGKVETLYFVLSRDPVRHSQNFEIFLNETEYCVEN